MIGPVTRIGRKLTGSAGTATKSTSSSFDNVVNASSDTVQRGIDEAGTSYRSAYRTTVGGAVGGAGIYGGYKATDIWGDTRQAEAEADEAQAFADAYNNILDDPNMTSEEKRDLLAELNDKFNAMFGDEGETPHWMTELDMFQIAMLGLVLIAVVKVGGEVLARR